MPANTVRLITIKVFAVKVNGPRLRDCTLAEKQAVSIMYAIFPNKGKALILSVRLRQGG